MPNRKFTEEECVVNGGHFWKYWRANTPVDKKTFEPDYSCGSYAVYYPNGEPEYRGCPLCGRVEEHIDRWEKRGDSTRPDVSNNVSIKVGGK